MKRYGVEVVVIVEAEDEADARDMMEVALNERFGSSHHRISRSFRADGFTPEIPCGREWDYGSGSAWCERPKGHDGPHESIERWDIYEVIRHWKQA